MMKNDAALLLGQIEAFIETDPWYVPCLSNVSAVLMEGLPDLNWAGFYLLRGGRLVVGPFQGKPACIHIQAGKGVCGTSVQKNETIVVPDVHAFPGHIACDSASRSEIVVPIRAKGKIAAVLDIDSPLKDRFTGEDRQLLEKIAALLGERAVWEEER